MAVLSLFRISKRQELHAGIIGHMLQFFSISRLFVYIFRTRFENEQFAKYLKHRN